MKTSTQLKARIRNLSKKTNVSNEVLFRTFMLERFLERVSLSKYKDNFILKGGMLIASIIGIDIRSTMDMDAIIKGWKLTENELSEICTHIINIDIDDGTEFSLSSIKEIIEDADYPGYRISFDVRFDKTRQVIKIDVAIGDSITPKEIEYEYKLMFEDRSINILASNIETVLADKLEATISRSITNTRMRDFYDIYIITSTQTFNNDIFKDAFNRLIVIKNLSEQVNEIMKIIQKISDSNIMIDLWKRYQINNSYASEISWTSIISAVKSLALIIEGGESE